MADSQEFMDAIFMIVRESFRLHAARLGGATSERLESHAESAAYRVNAEIVKLYGGLQTYVPKEGPYTRKGIIRDFTGDNVEALAKQYGITSDTVYRILRDDRKTKSALQQGRLPGV